MGEAQYHAALHKPTLVDLQGEEFNVVCGLVHGTLCGSALRAVQGEV